MDSANKQDAIIAEVTVGTTPATPAFLLLRTTNISGDPNRPANRSPERVTNRQISNMTEGLHTYAKSLNLPYARDAATDALWTSAFGAAWATNALKIGSTQLTVSLEEKYEGGVTDPYRRTTGCQVDQVSVGFQNGQPGTLAFGIKALGESTATTAIASSTYASPTPGDDPITPANITVNTLFGLTTPKVSAFNFTLTNNLYEKYAFGSADPFGVGFGLFSLEGTVEIYLQQLADYSAFIPRLSGQTLDMTIGGVATHKDQFVANNVDVWNPVIKDPGASGTHTIVLNFAAKYKTSDASSIILNRNVA